MDRQIMEWVSARPGVCANTENTACTMYMYLYVSCDVVV